MKNSDKQRISELESRVTFLESILLNLESGLFSLGSTSSKIGRSYGCPDCMAFEPQRTNYVCNRPNCCQGLNPADDRPRKKGKIANEQS